MRNMLTEMNNEHFSERLYYADNSSATACHNGNISAARMAQADTAFTFYYYYDLQNRLIESKREHRGIKEPCEWFEYDKRGNIKKIQRYDVAYLRDYLTLTYQDDGNRPISIRDEGQDSHANSHIEYYDYHDATTNDPDMLYDANGNLIYDADRGISVIHYNILNLPDTIQFVNGNQIVNLYDAAGRKYKSVVFTVPPTAVAPQYEIVHYPYGVDSLSYLITDYAGNIETVYTDEDTLTRRIHNSIGYNADGVYYHYIKDHLGNICAVVNSETNNPIQSTIYYASGVPMPMSSGMDEQPYLYNGKEFVTAHELNTYDYGFRGYYTTIGRFTTLDPLAEQTPWQSPYSYAGNRFVNAIDWMGLGGMTGFSHSGDVCQYIVINKDGNWLGGVDDGDNTIYVDEDGYWDMSEGKGLLKAVGQMMFSFEWYVQHAHNAILEGHAYRVPGIYYGQLSISFSCAVGLNWQNGFTYNEKINAQIGVNLLSYEIVKGSIDYDQENRYDFSYIGKNNHINITHGCGIKVNSIGFSVSQAFQVYATDLDYVPGSTINKSSFTYRNGLKWNVNSDGFVNLTFSISCGISASVTIVGNIYYQGGDEL